MKKIALLIIATIFMFACQPKKSESTENADSTATTVVVEPNVLEDAPVEEEMPKETFYTVRGQVVKVAPADAEGNAMVTVNHEEVPDVMMAMKMDFKTNAAFLSEIAKDDKVSFELVKTEEGYMMRNIEKLPAETELTLKK